jgi:polyisoprenoid-binding protein YceI
VTLLTGIHAVDPSSGELLVLTYREGVAQRAGHDLVLEATAWTATVEVGDDGMPASVAVHADPRSLHVRRGLHGAKPLTDSDRASIRQNIVRKVLGTSPIAFESTSIDGVPARMVVAGDLTVAGATRRAAFIATSDEAGRVTGSLALRQTEWGITPYRALMGALKVRDEVEVRVDLRLPAA